MIVSIGLALAGGALIGLAASWLLLSHGQIAGISGILGELLGPWDSKASWRISFLLGLLLGGTLLAAKSPLVMASANGRPHLALAAAGILVGYGTRLGNGCTSGHGVCGLTRLSRRSMVATATFMAASFLAATLFGMIGWTS